MSICFLSASACIDFYKHFPETMKYRIGMAEKGLSIKWIKSLNLHLIINRNSAFLNSNSVELELHKWSQENHVCLFCP